MRRSVSLLLFGRLDRYRSIKPCIGMALAALLALGLPLTAQAKSRQSISVIGSSTVFPFAKVVAERFGRATRYKTPTIEQIGTGGGFREFCRRVGVGSFDIANASRRIKKREFKRCIANGVDKIIEVQIGYDGIVIVNSVNAETYELSTRDVYLALSKYVPDPAGAERAVKNPYRLWSDVNAGLPHKPIEVLGPSHSSGTRDTFIDLIITKGCRSYGWVRALRKQDNKTYRNLCVQLRDDGRYVDAGENDHVILQKLGIKPNALGIFGYSFLDQNPSAVKAATIDGVTPDFDTISSGEYPITRALYFYVKKAHLGIIAGLDEYIREFTSEKAWGDQGYLADKGLIPSSADERKRYKVSATALEELSMDEL